jgi:hypothetical protein
LEEDKRAEEEARRKAEEEARRMEEERRKEELAREGASKDEPAPPPPPPPPPPKPKPKPKPPPKPKGVTKTTVLILNECSALGFALTGSVKKPYVWALAKIKGKTVTVKNPGVEKPISLRYGWGDVPKSSLFNREWYPAVFFRAEAPGKGKKK